MFMFKKLLPLVCIVLLSSCLNKPHKEVAAPIDTGDPLAQEKAKQEIIEENFEEIYQEEDQEVNDVVEDELQADVRDIAMEDSKLEIEKEEDAQLIESRIQKDKERCAEFEGENKLNCIGGIYVDIAVQKSDINFCNDIEEEESIKSNCRLFYAVRLAMSEDNIEKCGELLKDNEKNLCEANINLNKAVVSNDKALCESIVVVEKKDECLDNFIMRDVFAKGDKNACNQIKTANIKDSCVFNMIMNDANKNSKVELCQDTLLSQDKQTECQDNFYFNKSIQNKDAKECEKISKQSIKESCIKNMERILEKNPS